jgi:DNA polymerase-3 subunit beta
VRIRVQQSDLNDALRIVERGISTKNTIPVLTGIFLSASGDHLTLRATDLEVGIQTVTSCDALQSGEVVLDGKVFLNLIRKAPTVELELTTDERNATTVSWGKSKYTVSGYPANNFPNPPALDDAVSITLSQDALRKLLARSTFAVGEDASRPWLSGVGFAFRTDTITAYGVQEACIATAVINLPQPTESMAKPIVNGKALGHLARMLSDEPGDEVTFSVAHNRVSFALPNTTFYANVIDGTYPDVSRFTPSSFRTKARMNRKVLLEVLDRSSFVVGNNVKVSIAQESVTVSAYRTGADASQEDVACVVEGEPLDIPFNAKFLIEYLRTLDHDEVEFRLNSEREPFIVIPPNDPTTRFLLMPIIKVQGM